MARWCVDSSVIISLTRGWLWGCACHDGCNRVQKGFRLTFLLAKGRRGDSVNCHIHPFDFKVLRYYILILFFFGIEQSNGPLTCSTAAYHCIECMLWNQWLDLRGDGSEKNAYA